MNDLSPWLFVDLGKISNLAKVNLYLHPQYNASEITFGVSNDRINWLKANAGSGPIIEYDISKYNLKYQYVGFQAKKLSNVSLGLLEFEVMGFINELSTPTPTVTSTPVISPTLTPINDPSGELSVKFEIESENTSSFSGKLTLKNPNTSYAWNGTCFDIQKITFDTTSQLTTVSGPGVLYSIIEDKVKLELQWNSIFPYGQTLEVMKL